MKDVRITFVLEKNIKNKLAIEAKRKGMSLSTLIRVLIINYFEKGEL